MIKNTEKVEKESSDRLGREGELREANVKEENNSDRALARELCEANIDGKKKVEKIDEKKEKKDGHRVHIL